jgi:hypothetical protein
MRYAKQARRKVVGLGCMVFLLVVGTMSVASAPAGAQSAPTSSMIECPVLSLANPNAGDFLGPGGLIISGLAFDPAATSGSGVERVDLFLGERDQGGLFLGSAVPGSAGGDPRAFSVEVSIPSTLNRGVDFAAYAISSVTDHQTAISFPIFVGTPAKTSATPTPIGTTVTVASTCPGGVAAATGGAPAPASTPAPVAPAPAPPTGGGGASMSTGPSGTTCPVLMLANPNPGDFMVAGGLVISGLAFDPGASSGSGISRVDLFLGERDQGGLFLGTAVPGAAAGSDPRAFSLTVQVPSVNRGTDFAAYAIADSGQQTSVTFPVFVGVPSVTSATPTPIGTSRTVTTSCGLHITS